jgi:hypothetical protein
MPEKPASHFVPLAPTDNHILAQLGRITSSIFDHIGLKNFTVSYHGFNNLLGIAGVMGEIGGIGRAARRPAQYPHIFTLIPALSKETI